MIQSAGHEQSEIAAISCQDQGRSTARVLQKGWYQVSTGGCFDLRGLRGGCGRTGFETTVGSRMVGFRSLSCRVFKMGFNSIAILGFGLISDLTRFTIYFRIDPDFGSGFSCVFMCVFNAPAFPQRL